MVVRASDRCAVCRCSPLTRPFIAFVCRHFFHRDCLEAKVRESPATGVEYKRLERERRLLEKEVEMASAAAMAAAAANPNDGDASLSGRSQMLLLQALGAGKRRGEQQKQKQKTGKNL